MSTFFIAIVCVGIAVFAYLHFTSKKEEDVYKPSEPLPPFNPNPDNLHPKGDEQEPDFIFLYAGDVINRDGKTYEWNETLKKYIEVV
jgi:hypothetical protein